MRSGGVTYGLAGSVQRIGRVHLVRKDGVWQSRSREVSFGEAWLGRFALERIGLDRQVRDRNGKAVRDRTGCVRSGRTRQSRTGSVRSNKARFGMAVKDRSGMIGYGVITHERSLYESNHG